MEDEIDEYAPTAHGCIIVNGHGVFENKWVFGMESNICTCGALAEGSTYESSPMTLHTLTCASTPCPMCYLESKLLPGGGDTTTQNSAG